MSFFPQQPDLAGAVGQQILSEKALGHGKPFGAFAHQHDVAAVLHHRLRQQRHVPDVAHRAHRAGAPRGAVHARGVQLDHAVFIGESPKTNTVVVGIVFLRFAHGDGGVERIAAGLEHVVAALAAIPKLLHDNRDERRRACALIEEVLSASAGISCEVAKRLKQVAGLFGLEGDAVPFDPKVKAS